MCGHRFKFPLIAVALAMAAAACNATGATPMPTIAPTATAGTRTAGATSAPSITTPAALRGSWSADVIGTTASSGTWTLNITESNISLQNPVGGDPFTLDPVSMTAASMVLPAATDCPDQPVATEGTYTLALTGNTLTITLVHDSCGDRSATLVTSPWVRKG